MIHYYLSRVARAGPTDLSARVPELAPLRTKSAVIFGLGAIGAPIALDLARAGINELRMVDPDIVEAATTVRWPFGLRAAGHVKVGFIAQFIRENYPHTKVVATTHRVGGMPNIDTSLNDGTLIENLIAGVSLIIDATAEVGVQHFLSDLARERSLNFISVDATSGAWGGSICRIRPKKTTGCWTCYRHSLMDGSIPLPPASPSGDIQPAGCADPTFTGSGFDLGFVSLQTVRMAIATLCEDEPIGYPDFDCDAVTIALRSDNNKLLVPTYQGFQLKKHPNCKGCLP